MNTDPTVPLIITITSDNDAWDVFEKAMNNVFTEDVELKFENWPILNIVMKSPIHYGSLTARNMAGMIELQNSIYRTYALTVYNTLSLTRLSDDDKNRLALVFKISEGSSDIITFLFDQLESLTQGMKDKMEPKHYLVLVLGAGLIWASYAGYSNWLQNEKDMFLAEQQTKTRRIELDERQFATTEETRRMELLTSAFAVEPKLEQIQETVDETRAAIFKSALDAESITIAGVENVKGTTLKTILSSPRSKSVDDRLDGIFRIVKVDSSKFDYFTVTLRNIDDGVVISAQIKDSDIVEKKKKTCLQEAEWNKRPVLVQMNIKRNKGNIVDASIVKVEQPDATVLKMIDDGITNLSVNWDSSKGFVVNLPKR
jgi:hypothetical protein